MTVASPGFLLYGFFSGEWLIEDISNSSIVNQTSGDYNIYYGLYEKCYQGNCSNYGEFFRYDPCNFLNGAAARSIAPASA